MHRTDNKYNQHKSDCNASSADAHYSIINVKYCATFLFIIYFSVSYKVFCGWLLQSQEWKNMERNKILWLEDCASHIWLTMFCGLILGRLDDGETTLQLVHGMTITFC